MPQPWTLLALLPEDVMLKIVHSVKRVQTV